MSPDRRVLDDVTVVIPTLGRPLVRDCLQSIAAGTAWPGRLVVVDQSASAEVAGWVDDVRRTGLQAEHHPSTGRGVAAATNAGVEAADSDIVVVTHDDCRVASTWLATLAERMAAGSRPQVVTGRILPEGGAEVPSVMTSTTPAVHTRPRLDRDVLFPASMALHRSLWNTVGPMDEDPCLARASEDNEWAYRCLRAGVPIAYEPAAVVTHVAWRDADDLRDVERVYARAQGAFYGKHLRARDPHFLLRVGFDLAHQLWWMVRGALTSDTTLRRRGGRTAAATLAGLRDGLRSPHPLVRPAGTGRRRVAG